MDSLTKIISHAYKNSLLYQQKKPEQYEESKEPDITEFPIIQKQDLFHNVPAEIMDYVMGRILEEEVVQMSTSGSTGICLPVLWHKNDYRRSMAPLWMLRKKYYNISPNDKLCYFYTIREDGERDPVYEFRNQTLGFSKCSLDEERIYNIYQMILDFGPKWMLLQPSMAELLLEAAQKFGLPPVKELEYIEFSGEMLFQELRERVKRFFGCQVSDQYGSNEVNSIALECPHGNMHCTSSNVYVEITDEKGKVISDDSEGEIIVTSLNNRIMPFVRYRIGDRGRIRHDIKCSCGNRNPVLELTMGRSNDSIRTRQGRKINPYIFVHAVEAINCSYDDVIKQFQVVQRDYNRFRVLLRIDDHSVKEDIEELFVRYILEPELKQAEYEFIYSDSFINGDGRKLRYFTNDMERE